MGVERAHSAKRESDRSIEANSERIAAFLVAPFKPLKAWVAQGGAERMETIIKRTRFLETR